MPPDRDHYEAYYADKLWQLLPEVYRAQDSDDPDLDGPLRELVERIGAQAAIVRRSIDRLWEDQSIETSDDWLIPYIGDLLATNLVGGMGTRGQRLDVAKTVYYRRRKGTLPLLEELGQDVTGWELRVVEFFRRLGRTRHGLDPAIGSPENEGDPEGERTLQHAEGLVGPHSRSSIGGFADLRNAHAAVQAHTAFDEFSSTADMRRGVGHVGWHNIPRLGAFLWRLYSFEVRASTPVKSTACNDLYAFDPTGRDIQLFARDARQGAGFDAAWLPVQEWQLPAPIGTALLREQVSQLHVPLAPEDGDRLYPGSLSVRRHAGSFYDVVDDVTQLRLYPEIGRFHITQQAPADFRVAYHYGFSSRIGAGPYDRRVVGASTPAEFAPAQPVLTGGGDASAALLALGSTGTLTLDDSLTYGPVADLPAIRQVTVRAANRQRPVIRLQAGAPAWVFAGASPDSELVIDGLFVSGADVVIAGDFARVQLNCCTLDPGGAGTAAGTYASAIDGQSLIPTRLRVAGRVRELIVSRSILGAVVVSGAGSVARLRLQDTIVQSVWDEPALALADSEAELERCTVMGTAVLRRLEASESILGDVFSVDDYQHGCVRFSAWSTDSVIPGPYESVEIAPRAPLFTSRVFGKPAYAQLLIGVDAQILSGRQGASIAEGAEDGSEMGAFWRERHAVKQRALAIKYQEFMPLGMVPVFVPVT
jgi:hypothetical protein